MAGVPDDDSSAFPGDASGHLNPALAQFVGAQQTDAGKDWADAAVNRVQDYLTQKAVVAQTQQAGDDFVNNLATAKQGLVGMVQSDPGTTDLALDLAGHTVQGLVAQHGNLSDEDRSSATDSLIHHMHAEIAHAGVQRLAEIDKPSALTALGRYSDLLPDDQVGALRQYIDVQEGLRGQDNAAMAGQGYLDAATAGYQAASSHLASFTDPDTAGFRAQPGFLSNLAGDQSISLPTKLALQHGYTQLAQNGDAPQSNPHVAADMLMRLGSDPPAQGEIMAHLGSNLTVNDATFLNGLIAPATPQRRSDLRLLSDTVIKARDTLTADKYGGAGTAAFGKFVSDLMPQLQRGANLTELMDGNAIQKYAPTWQDYVSNQASQQRQPVFAQNDIPDPDKVRRLENLEFENRQPRAPPSGDFFQRKLREQQERENG